MPCHHKALSVALLPTMPLHTPSHLGQLESVKIKLPKSRYYLGRLPKATNKSNASKGLKKTVPKPNSYMFETPRFRRDQSTNKKQQQFRSRLRDFTGVVHSQSKYYSNKENSIRVDCYHKCEEKYRSISKEVRSLQASLDLQWKTLLKALHRSQNPEEVQKSIEGVNEYVRTRVALSLRKDKACKMFDQAKL